jgi:hypothetical protein
MTAPRLPRARPISYWDNQILTETVGRRPPATCAEMAGPPTAPEPCLPTLTPVTEEPHPCAPDTEREELDHDREDA